LHNNAPESLSFRIKQCQEVAIISCNPYSEKQLIAKTIHLLRQSGIFLMKEFEDWEATNNKTWTSLKTFVHGAFQCQLMAVGICGSTSGQKGYAPMMNPFTIMAEGLDLDNDTMVTQMAVAVTVGSTLGNRYTTPAPPLMMTNQLMLAMQLLAVNQQVSYQHIAPMLQHMAAMTYHVNQPSLQPRVFPAPHTTPFHVPPIQNLQILAQGNFNPCPPPFNEGGRYNARGYRQGGQSAGDCSRGRGHQNCRCQNHGHLPFAEHMACGGGNQGATGTLFNPNAQRMTHLNVNKFYGNWNACYLCGFDIEDGHTSMTCPRDWRKPIHIEAFTRANAQSYIAAGYDCCTKRMHKTVLPKAAF
jgi:hypothetical protein